MPSFRLPPVVKNLLIINILIWLVGVLIPNLGNALERYLALHYFTSPGFNAVQLVTYMFLHGGFMHLFFNMFALFMFGRIIEMAMGSKRFLIYYMCCGIFAALVQMAAYAYMIHKYSVGVSAEDVQYITNEGWRLITQGYTFTDRTAAILNSLINGSMVGASGAIYGVILAFGMLFPNQPIYIYFIPIPIAAKWIVIGYGILELTQGLSNALADNVAHFAHLGGMIAGVILILYWRKKGYFRRGWYY